MFILDTCAFFSQKHPDREFLTVPGIENEIINKQSKQYFESMLSTKMKVSKASEDSYKIITKQAKETGDFSTGWPDLDTISLPPWLDGEI